MFQAPVTLSTSDLIEYFEKNIPTNDKNRELYLARSILVWIESTCQVKSGRQYPLDSPAHIVSTQLIASSFAKLCK